MNRTLAVLVVACGLAAAAVTAEDVAAHKSRMDAEEDLKYQLQDALEAKSAPALAKAAKQLQTLARQEETYWSAAAVEEAWRLAAESRTQAQQIATAADSGDLTSAASAFKQLNTTCTGCHDLHPEKRVVTIK